MTENRFIRLNPAWNINLDKEFTWNEFIDFVQGIPYGRSSERGKLPLVITENKGTCSSKHALLKQVADENGVMNVALILGMYQMNQSNTPGIGSVLEDHNLPYIPEAHCYLKINKERFDFTNADSDIQKIANDLLCELEITPSQITSFKVQYHQNYLQNWLKEKAISMTFDQLWDIREACIIQLTK